MFYENLIAACGRQGIKLTPLIKELGISTGSLRPWKRGGSVNSDVLLKLSERLGVTTDYLLKGTRQTGADAIYCVNEKEESLLAMYREIPAMNQDFIYDAIKTAYDRVQEEKDNAAKLLG